MQTALRANAASSLRASSTAIRCRARLTVQPFCAAAEAAPERLRLHNLSPWEGSRRQELRKGRGHGAGQGGTCGFGNRGQNSRSGKSVRPGFEGGQMPLYRKLPKLRGIAGGMAAGLPKFVTVNLDDLSKHFEAGSEVSLEALKARGLLNTSGREDKLPLKILGDGEISVALTIKAAKFSGSASEKIAAAGGATEVVAGRRKWTKKAHKAQVAALKANGQDYEKIAKERRTQRALNKKARHAAEVEARRAARASA